MFESTSTILDFLHSESHNALMFLITEVYPDGQISRQFYSLVDLDSSSQFQSSILGPDEIISILRRLLSLGKTTDFIAVEKQGKIHFLVAEVIKPRNSLLIFGAGHVGNAVAQLGSAIGYDVTIYDDRKEFLTNEKLPLSTITKIHAKFEDVTSLIGIHASSAIVIVTRGHQHDETCLKAALKSQAKYIGMIGSKRRVLSIFDRLHNQGFSTLETDRVYAPIGLRINAKTPQEIAISILAQIIQVMNN